MNYFYCVLYEDDRNLFDVFGPISDDSFFTDLVAKGQLKGMHVRCSTIDASGVESIEDLKHAGDTMGFCYHNGLIQELGFNIEL